MTKKLFNKLLVLVSFVCLAFIVVACTKVEEVFIMGPSSVEVGSVIDLEATISPESAQGKKVTWTVDDDTIATIDKDGKLTGVSPGKVTVTATAQKKEGTKEVTVVAPVASPTSVAVNGDDKVFIGSTITLTAVPTPSGSYAATVWTSSNANIATVNSSGVVTGVAKGNVTISARIGNTTGTRSVEVEEIVYDVPTLVAITGAKDVEVEKTLTLGITITPSQGNYPATVWSSSDDTVASVSTTGVVSGVSAGKVTISVDVNGVKDEVEINVFVPINTPDSIEINGGSSVDVGKTISLSVTSTPAGNYGPTTWTSSDTNIATVSNAGVVTGRSVGTVTITAKVGETTNTKLITVNPLVVEDMEIVGPDEVFVGESYKYSIIFTPTGSTGEVEWMINKTDVATIDQEGNVTVIKGNEIFTIYAFLDDIETTYDVFAEWVELEDIIIHGPSEVTVGEQYQYTIELVPITGNPNVTWTILHSTLGSIGVQSGLFTPSAAGETQIRVNGAGITSSHDVVIVLPDVTSINISGPSEVTLNSTFTYTAIITPTHASKLVDWSVSDESIATINGNGILTPLKGGKVTVTVVARGTEFSDEIEVEVIVPPVESISLTGPNKLYFGTTTIPTYVGKVSPTTAVQDITYEVNDSSIATIDQTGKLTILKGGDIIIKVTSTYDSSKNTSLLVSVIKSGIVDETGTEEDSYLTIKAAFEDGVRDVLVYPGSYSDDLDITMNYTTIKGEDPDLVIITGKITLSNTLVDCKIEGIYFQDTSSIEGKAWTGSAGTGVDPRMSRNGFYFINNKVDVKVGTFLKFYEGSSVYSHNIVLLDNYFTSTASGTLPLLHIDNNVNLTIAGNYFKDIAGSAILLDDTTKGVAGFLDISNNTFVNIGGDALKINWMSPNKNPTIAVIEIVISGNYFENIHNRAIHLGSFNNADYFRGIYIIYNSFIDINVGIYLGKTHSISGEVVVNYNYFLDEPASHYIYVDDNVSTHRKDLNATNNYFEFDPDNTRFYHKDTTLVIDYDTSLTDSSSLEHVLKAMLGDINYRYLGPHWGDFEGGNEVLPTTLDVNPTAGTYANQEEKAGFGGLYMKIGNDAVFIGEGAYIKITAEQLNAQPNDAAKIAYLRPYGIGVANSNGIIRGEDGNANVSPTFGYGALYYNAGFDDMMFMSQWTYGRDYYGVQVYIRYIFSPNENGTYTVKYATSASGHSEQITLKPGEYLWCPYTAERWNTGFCDTAQEAPIWWNAPGNASIKEAWGNYGVISPGAIVEIGRFK